MQAGSKREHYVFEFDWTNCTKYCNTVGNFVANLSSYKNNSKSITSSLSEDCTPLYKHFYIDKSLLGAISLNQKPALERVFFHFLS